MRLEIVSCRWGVEPDDKSQEGCDGDSLCREPFGPVNDRRRPSL